MHFRMNLTIVLEVFLLLHTRHYCLTGRPTNLENNLQSLHLLASFEEDLTCDKLNKDAADRPHIHSKRVVSEA